MADRLALFAAALWWGALSAIIGFVVPMLFAHLPSKSIAAHMAASLFTAQAWVSLACGGVLLLALKGRAGQGGAASPARSTLLIVMAGMLLALLIEFAVAPRIVARVNLRLWHGAGTAMFALQWLCAALVLWRLGSERRP